MDRMEQGLRYIEANPELFSATWAVSSKDKLKTDWTWEEWQASRAKRRAVAAKIGPSVVRRKESASDARLRKAFNGERGPTFE